MAFFFGFLFSYLNWKAQLGVNHLTSFRKMYRPEVGSCMAMDFVYGFPMSASWKAIRVMTTCSRHPCSQASCPNLKSQRVLGACN